MKHCCEKCDARQISSVLGGADCWNESCGCHKEAELRKLARDTYIKTRTGRGHMPHPDSDEGQRKIDRLFDIIQKPFLPADADRESSK